MSYTEVHLVGPEAGNGHILGETKNAWRGAMYVWNHIGEKYLSISSFPFSDEELQRKIWNAGNHANLDEHDLFVLAITMDGAAINVKDKKYAIDMMMKFQEENENSSIGEQAELIRSCDSPEGWIAFCQTSVSDFWGVEWDDNIEEDVYIDLFTRDNAFDAVKQTKDLITTIKERL